jgi:hypothetical protein
VRVDAFKCDQCGVLRGPSNHWLMSASATGGITFKPWEDHETGDTRLKHICGVSCAATLLSQTLDGWRTTAPPEAE